MKRVIFLIVIILFLSGCETTTQKTFLPSTRPADFVVEYHDGMEGKDFYLSEDSSYAIFKLNEETKKIYFDLNAVDMDRLFNEFQINNFSRIDTVKIPITNLTEEGKKPVYSVKASWGGITVEKFVSVNIGIKEEWKDKFKKIVDAIQAIAYSGIEIARRSFILDLDKSLFPDNSFMTVDMNTYFSGDSLFFYNSNDMGRKDTLNVRVLDGKNIINLFVNVKEPKPGQSFVIADRLFEINISKDMNGIKFYLEGDSLKWNPIK